MKIFPNHFLHTDVRLPVKHRYQSVLIAKLVNLSKGRAREFTEKDRLISASCMSSSREGHLDFIESA